MAIKTKKKASEKEAAAPVAKPVGKKTKIKAAALNTLKKKAKKKKPPTLKELEKFHKFVTTHKLVRCGKISPYFRKKGTRKGTPSAFRLSFDAKGKFHVIDMEKKRKQLASGKVKSGKSSGIKRKKSA